MHTTLTAHVPPHTIIVNYLWPKHSFLDHSHSIAFALDAVDVLYLDANVQSISLFCLSSFVWGRYRETCMRLLENHTLCWRCRRVESNLYCTPRQMWKSTVLQSKNAWNNTHIRSPIELADMAGSIVIFPPRLTCDAWHGNRKGHKWLLECMVFFAIRVRHMNVGLFMNKDLFATTQITWSSHSRSFSQ